MIKTINFPPYNVGQIKAINEDGSVVCDLFGESYNDTDICFPADSKIISLTAEEIEQFNAEQTAIVEMKLFETFKNRKNLLIW